MPKINDEQIVRFLEEKIRLESGFGRNNPAMIALKKSLDDSTRRDAALCRYPAMLAPHDDQMPHYNANKVIGEKLWTGEGPAKQTPGYNNLSRFMATVIFNESIDFKHIIALGPEYELTRDMQSFFPYFRNPFEAKTHHHLEDDTGYSLDADRLELKFPRFTDYRLLASRPHGEKKELLITHFQDMEDMNSLITSPAIIAKLLMLADSLEHQAIYMHCSAGLGRSGTIAYAFMIYQRYSQLIEKEGAERVDALFLLFSALNISRPGSIQMPGQLKNALDIAEGMHQLKQQLILEQKSIGDHLADIADNIDLDSSDVSDDEASAVDAMPRRIVRVKVRLFKPGETEIPTEDSRDERSETISPA